MQKNISQDLIFTHGKDFQQTKNRRKFSLADRGHGQKTPQIILQLVIEDWILSPEHGNKGRIYTFKTYIQVNTWILGEIFVNDTVINS